MHREAVEEKVILFGLTSIGYFDMTAYEAYNNGTMTTYPARTRVSSSMTLSRSTGLDT